MTPAKPNTMLTQHSITHDFQLRNIQIIINSPEDQFPAHQGITIKTKRNVNKKTVQTFYKSYYQRVKSLNVSASLCELPYRGNTNCHKSNHET